jgi:hypothetical protein
MYKSSTVWKNLSNHYESRMKMNIFSILAVFILVLTVPTGCATIGREQEREMNRMADSALAEMVLAYPGLQSQLGASPGYLVVERSGSGLPLVAKRGKGSLTDLKSGERVAVRMLELEIDGAWGVGDYTAVYVFQNAEDFDTAFDGSWTAESVGSVYVRAGREPVAVYTIKKIRIERLD